MLGFFTVSDDLLRLGTNDASTMILVAMTVHLFQDYLDRLVSFDMRSRAGPRFVGLLAVALLIGTTILWITVQSKVFGIW